MKLTLDLVAENRRSASDFARFLALNVENGDALTVRCVSQHGTQGEYELHGNACGTAMLISRPATVAEVLRVNRLALAATILMGGVCEAMMNREDILATILRAPAWRPADDAHLYLWVTNTYLPDGLWLMDALGFKYKTNVAWAKPSFGIGFYFRGQHELCLFGTRGAVQRTKATNLSGLLVADRGRDEHGKVKHSKKPGEFYDLVEARSPGPFVELFARNTRPGWESWGDEVTP